jgi:hypothetical protein
VHGSDLVEGFGVEAVEVTLFEHDVQAAPMLLTHRGEGTAFGAVVGDPPSSRTSPGAATVIGSA